MTVLGFSVCPFIPNQLAFFLRCREPLPRPTFSNWNGQYQMRVETTRATNATRRVIIAVDVGSSSVKSALYYVEGVKQDDSILGPVFRKTHMTSTADFGAVTQKPNDWYTGAVETIKRVMAVAVSEDCSVIAISVTGQMQDFIAVGESPPALLKEDALLYADRRAIVQARELSARLGVTIPATSLLAKLKLIPLPLSIQSGREPHYNILLGAADFITYMFTGCPDIAYTDATTVSTTGLSIPPLHRKYDLNMLRRAGLDSFVEHLPVILDRPRVVGTLCEEVAKAIGFACLGGIDVIHAGGDAFTATVGAGCSDVESGAYLYAGTTGWVAKTASYSHYFALKSRSLFCLGHASERYYNIIAASVASVGSAFLHACTVFLRCQPSDIDILASGSEIGARGVVYIPYINGRRCPSPKDSTVAGFYGVTISTTRADFARALVEGVVFSFVEAMDEFPSTFDFKQLPVVGGACECQTFLQGISAFIGGIELCHPEAGLAGAGETAAVAIAIPPRITRVSPVSIAPTDPADITAWHRSLKKWRRVLKAYESLW